jgi:hypothetical protein
VDIFVPVSSVGASEVYLFRKNTPNHLPPRENYYQRMSFGGTNLTGRTRKRSILNKKGRKWKDERNLS